MPESSVDSYINAQPEQAMDFNEFYNNYGREKYKNSKDRWIEMDPNHWLAKLGNFFTGDVDYAKNKYEAYLTNLKNRNEFLATQSARQWEKMMDDTKVQRTLKDYEKAGLNPYLLISDGGFGVSSAPSAAKASYDTHSMKKADKDSDSLKSAAGLATLLIAVMKVAAMLL